MHSPRLLKHFAQLLTDWMGNIFFVKKSQKYTFWSFFGFFFFHCTIYSSVSILYNNNIQYFFLFHSIRIPFPFVYMLINAGCVFLTSIFVECENVIFFLLFLFFCSAWYLWRLVDSSWWHLIYTQIFFWCWLGLLEC